MRPLKQKAMTASLLSSVAIVLNSLHFNHSVDRLAFHTVDECHSLLLTTKAIAELVTAESLDISARSDVRARKGPGVRWDIDWNCSSAGHLPIMRQLSL
jgi:hypothetical protein